MKLVFCILFFCYLTKNFTHTFLLEDNLHNILVDNKEPYINNSLNNMGHLKKKLYFKNNFNAEFFRKKYGCIKNELKFLVEKDKNLINKKIKTKMKFEKSAIKKKNTSMVQSNNCSEKSNSDVMVDLSSSIIQNGKLFNFYK